jgi:hypothetical protein
MPFPMFLGDLQIPQLFHMPENRQVSHPRLEWKTTCFSRVVPVGKQQASEVTRRTQKSTEATSYQGKIKIRTMS